MMIDESLNTYRQERRAFIAGLKHYYGIDFYKMDKRERTQWLQSYISSKREFFQHLLEHWQEFPPTLIGCFPHGYIIDKKEGKFKPKGTPYYATRSKRR